MACTLIDPLPPHISSLVTGAEQVEKLFGGWPRFHDSEVMRMVLDRQGPRLDAVIRAFRPPCSTYTITFTAEGLSEIDLADFNHQNVLSEVSIETVGKGGPVHLRITFHGIFGVRAIFDCDRLKVAVEGAEPPETP